MILNAKIEIPDEFINQLVTKEWLEKIIKEQLGDKGYIILSPADDTEVPTLPKCKAGPNIETIIVVSSKQLRVGWYGVDIQEIEASLKTGNTLIETVTFKPTNDKSLITFKNDIKLGTTYTLEFKATNCDGSSSKDFTYKSNI